MKQFYIIQIQFNRMKILFEDLLDVIGFADHIQLFDQGLFIDVEDSH